MACSAATWTGYAGTDAPSSSPSLPELLEKAIFTEETVGDLDAAIEIYRQILERTEADRSYVAQAQFRLGMCYVKQGKTEEAAETLRQLVADFPQQDELVSTARARLAELGHALPEPGVVIRQVWDGAGDFVGSLSPDGRYTTFTDWSTGNLILHDLTSGQDQNLTGKDWSESGSFPEWSGISPDGKRVAYSWFNDDGVYDLRVMGLDGSAPRVLYANKNVPWLRFWAWSPDGKHILAHLTYTDRPAEMVLVSTEDGAVRALKTNSEYDGRPWFSPDGRYVAYSQPQDEKSGKRDIFLFPIAGDKERQLVEHPADDLVLGWAPNGSHLLFASDRTGVWGAWAIAIADGMAVGAPQLVKQGIGDVRFPGGDLVPMGFTREGSFYYRISKRSNDVYISMLEVGTGMVSKPPARATRRFEGTNTSPAWSRDGEKLAFVSHRTGALVIVIHSIETGEERDVRVSPEITYLTSLDWSPDGRSILAKARLGKGDWRALVIDAANGETMTEVVSADSRQGIFRHAQWSPDGNAVFFERRTRGETSGIVKLDLVSGVEQFILPRMVGTMALSWDGRWIAFTADVYAKTADNERPTLSVISANGGEPRVVFQSSISDPFGAGLTSIAWTPDDRHLIFGIGKLDPGRRKGIELLQVAVDGGEARKLGLTMPTPGLLRMHPDGDRIAWGTRKTKSVVWAMENFLPKLSSPTVTEMRP